MPLCSQIMSQNLMSVNSCLFEKKQMSDESCKTGVYLEKIILLMKELFVSCGNKISIDTSGAEAGAPGTNPWFNGTEPR